MRIVSFCHHQQTDLESQYDFLKRKFLICGTLQSTSKHPHPTGASHRKPKHVVQVWRHLLLHPLVVFSFIRVPTQAEVLGMFLFWELVLERGWGLRGNWRQSKKKDTTTRWQQHTALVTERA